MRRAQIPPYTVGVVVMWSPLEATTSPGFTCRAVPGARPAGAYAGSPARRTWRAAGSGPLTQPRRGARGLRRFLLPSAEDPATGARVCGLRGIPAPGGHLELPSVVTVSGATGGVRSLQHAAALRDGPLALGARADAVEAVLLAFEELASNGLRHGRPPVRVTVSQDDAGWLIDVTDAATDRTPTPAVDRDPAQGGLGLYLVARLSAAHGWWDEAGRRKHVWAFVRAALG